jgi:hypothetical protein
MKKLFATLTLCTMLTPALANDTEDEARAARHCKNETDYSACVERTKNAFLLREAVCHFAREARARDRLKGYVVPATEWIPIKGGRLKCPWPL